jgi:hypothetical protein
MFDIVTHTLALKSFILLFGTLTSALDTLMLLLGTQILACACFVSALATFLIKKHIFRF